MPCHSSLSLYLFRFLFQFLSLIYVEGPSPVPVPVPLHVRHRQAAPPYIRSPSRLLLIRLLLSPNSAEAEGAERKPVREGEHGIDFIDRYRSAGKQINVRTCDLINE